jgi:uncharacterized membrane protein YfcA
MALVLTMSRQFDWRDVLISAAATAPVVLGMAAGQRLRDRIAPKTFKRLVLIAVIAAGRRAGAARSVRLNGALALFPISARKCRRSFHRR